MNGKKGKTHEKSDKISGWSYTQTHRNLRYFNNHKCLSRSEESKCMWTCGKMASCECLWQVPPRGCETGSKEGWGLEGKLSGDYL